VGAIIGIDLGTTNTVCAFVEGGEPRIVINEEGGRITPSVVAFARNGDRLVGDVAKRQMLINPEGTLHSVKRLMGRRHAEATSDAGRSSVPVVANSNGDAGYDVAGRVWTPQEISAFVLAKIRLSAEAFLGREVTDAIITVPAHFTDRQRQATKDAGAIAGLNVVRIINEPTAAALAYVHKRDRRATIAVYDFGGGTFDVSIVQVDRDLGEVKATRGDNTLGGGDLDQLIVDWLFAQFFAEHGVDLSGDRVVSQRLRDAAERAKLELSAAQETDIQLPFLANTPSGPLHLQATLTRAHFEELAQPLFERTIEECRRALDDARLRVDQIDEVVLVGGSSRIPRVKELVREFFKRPLNQSFNPDEVVAIGAALQGAALEGEISAITLLDVTSFSLGIEVEGRRFARLIPKNTVIPAQKVQLVSTVQENQKVVKIHVLQGESDRAPENTSLGEFEVRGVEPGARGAARIEVKFAIDANGIVNVSARDTRTGVSGQITVRAPTGMSNDQIAAARAQTAAPSGRSAAPAPALAANDPSAASRAALEAEIKGLAALLAAIRGSLPKLQAMEADQAVKRGQMALEKKADLARIDETLAWVRRIHGHLREAAQDEPTR
jgi:molecular chaperone DnaK